MSDAEACRPIDDDAAWNDWRAQWPLRPGTIYLNHGSFGPPPRSVRAAQQEWQRRLAEQPMDFFVRQYEEAWIEARRRLAEFVSAAPDDMVFVENSTAAMNVVAHSVRLEPHDEVLLTDHAYGAVLRVWERACADVPATRVRIARLPSTIESEEQVVDAIFEAANERTRLLVVSHITSPTALVLPVARICEAARQRGLATCIDGPHAPAQAALRLDELGCDFYAASLHKWVSAPFGSGFLYVAPAWQERVQTPLLSWGRVSPTQPSSWWEEFVWPGTRDPSAYLATSAAIDLLEQQVGLARFRARTHFLAQYARQRIVAVTDLQPAIPDSDRWYGSMVTLPLPAGDAASLQQRLWFESGIEVPVLLHQGQRMIRVSCHLYNHRGEVDMLAEQLQRLLREE